MRRRCNKNKYRVGFPVDRYTNAVQLRGHQAQEERGSDIPQYARRGGRRRDQARAMDFGPRVLRDARLTMGTRTYSPT